MTRDTRDARLIVELCDVHQYDRGNRMHAQNLNAPDGLKKAAGRISIGPTPDWVTVEAFDVSFSGRRGVPLTHLLLDRQTHAERRQTCQRTATRLETMQAVQHESQWRLPFDSRSQSITLHWIRIHRGSERFDHADIDRGRLLQREEGLDRFVIDGWFTWLLLLEDVRPGDILDSCFTIEHEPRLLPENCASFFNLPPGIPVGKFRFSARFNDTRAMKWKSSSPDLKPAEQREHGEVLWTWTGLNQLTPEPEVNTPEWHVAEPWVQISDCPTWGAVAAAVAGAWKEQPDDVTLAEIAKEIIDSESDLLSRVERAIRLVQDEHRYLSVDLDLGGHVPTAPGTAVRRRFGDCKDLSFLLVHLLKRLGVEARPVLVNTTLRSSVAGFLPMANLFNHAIVEFTVQGQTRWVDATIPRQGGGALNRVTPDFGTGLPVDLAATDLVRFPLRSIQPSVYELTESILLDTTGAPSILAVALRATGNHAETLRQKFEAAGPEKVAEERLQICSQRFGDAKRAGSLQHRDNRPDNEFLLAEVFEINGFLSGHAEPDICTVGLPGTLVFDVLRLPQKAVRRTPFALPYPCNVVHTIEVESASLQPMAGPRCGLSNSFLEFSRRQKSLYKYWSMTVSLSTLRDAVPADQFDEHEKMVEQIWKESSWILFVPVGIAHPRRRHDFGELPLPPLAPKQAGTTTPAKQWAAVEGSGQAAAPVVSSRATGPDTRPGTDSVPEKPAFATTARPHVETAKLSSSRRGRRSRHGWTTWQKILVWAGIVGAIIILTFIVVVLASDPR